MSEPHSSVPRRSFLSRAGAAMTAFGAALGAGSAAAAQSTAPSEGRWQPARHREDDWLDQMPGKHRIIFDTISPEGVGRAIFFSNNVFTGNRNGYGLGDGDVAVVICVRHQSTPFAYNDAMWAKYGGPMAERAGFTDPKTGKRPIINVYRASEYGMLTNNGVTIDALLKHGVHFAVCQLATRAYAAAIARQTGGSTDDIYKELTSNLVGNGHMVPAGIVAVGRAQERGYAFAYGG